MRFALSVAALAGAALAAPHAGRPQQYKDDLGYVVELKTVVKTVYITEGYEAAKPTPKPTKVYEPPVVTSVYYEAPAPEPTDEYEEEPVYEPSEPETPSTNTGYMAVVDEWRGKLGMKALECDPKLEANAMDTVVASNGQMVHKLNPGTYGQNLAPGEADNFEHVFVGGWLCELPNLPGLNGVCAEQSQGWSYQGQTGHAEIITSERYSKIGCALHAGIWCCDFA